MHGEYFYAHFEIHIWLGCIWFIGIREIACPCGNSKNRTHYYGNHGKIEFGFVWEMVGFGLSDNIFSCSTGKIDLAFFQIFQSPVMFIDKFDSLGRIPIQVIRRIYILATAQLHKWCNNG